MLLEKVRRKLHRLFDKNYRVKYNLV